MQAQIDQLAEQLRAEHSDATSKQLVLESKQAEVLAIRCETEKHVEMMQLRADQQVRTCYGVESM